jgi:hypothetical protein
MTPEEAATAADELAGERVRVRTTYGKTLEGVLVKATERAIVVDTVDPGQRGVFIGQVEWVRPADEEAPGDAGELRYKAHDCGCGAGDDEECECECEDEDDGDVVKSWRNRLGFDAYDPLEFRDYSDRTRAMYARAGVALADGSFPIRTGKDLRSAVLSLGRARDMAEARSHIVRRARELGATHLLPASWPESTVASDRHRARLDRMERAVAALAHLAFSPLTDRG